MMSKPARPKLAGVSRCESSASSFCCNAVALAISAALNSTADAANGQHSDRDTSRDRGRRVMGPHLERKGPTLTPRHHRQPVTDGTGTYDVTRTPVPNGGSHAAGASAVQSSTRQNTALR